MNIKTLPPNPPRLPKAPAQRTPEPPKPPAPSRGDAFVRGADAAAHTLAKVGGFTNGASLGYLGGALLAGTMGCSGGSSFALALAVGGVSGVAGWKVMDKVSDWAAREGARLVPGPLGEAGGRIALNLGMDLISGNRLTAIADLGITGGYGLYKMARA